VQPGRNVIFCVGKIVIRSFVFRHIPGGSFIFNISKGSGATLELRPPSPPPEDEVAVGTPPERSWAQDSTPVFDLQFELRLFVFIHIMG
jgi:hypothetical protein